MKKVEMSPVEQFLNELEKQILRQENIIQTIQEESEEKKYLEDLLEVLKVSKIGLIVELCSAKEERQEEFQRILKKVISNDREFHSILEEINNLFFLEKYHLLDREEVIPQRDRAFLAVDKMIKKIEEFLKKQKNRKEEKYLEELYNYMESLFDVATKFDGNELVEEFDDLDFLEDVINSMNLSPDIKSELVFYLFDKSNELASKPSKTVDKNIPYQELETLYYEDGLENTEELLDEMLAYSQEDEREVKYY